MTIELLKTFCGTDKSRPFLFEPWNAGGKTFACDGRILVEVPEIEFKRETDQKEFTFPNVLMKIAQCFPVTPVDWIPLLPDIPPNVQEPCENCAGNGGWTDGDIKVDCEDCDGTGQVEKMVGVEIGGLRLNVHYLNLMKALPGIEIAPTANPPVEDGAMPREMPFRFTGGRGIMMPMRK